MGQLELAQEVLRLARAASLHITTAESCTGGLLAGAITEVPGASDVFERGYVTYSNAAKIEMLGVLAAKLEQHGAVSENVAREMAAGALTSASADIAISITGIAGPGGSEHKPEGRVCFSLARSGQVVSSETVEFSAIGRAKIRAASVRHALKMLVAALC